MSYTSTGGLPTIPRLAVAGVDEGAPETVVTSGSPASLTSLTLPAQAVAPAAPASGVVLYANATGRLSWRSASDTFSRSIIVTATANRTFTAPDADFTFAGQNLANTFTLANTFSANGALSAPAVSFTGTPITGGSASTTQGLVKIGSGTSGGLSTSGTMLEVQAPAGFAGSLQYWGVNGSSVASINSSGTLSVAGSINLINATSSLQSNGDVFFLRKAPANWQLGAADAAAPVAQTLSVQSVVAGTSNTAGAAYTRITSLGTGTGGGGDDVLKQALTGASGTTQNTAGTRMYRRAKETTLTEATATKLFTVPLAAGGYIGMTITATVFASDGTDHQTITSTLNVNAVAKSTTITGTITQVDGTAANSSGTLTPVTYTVVDDGSNVLSVKCAATSSLAQTTLSCKWSITMLNSNVSAIITPL